MSEMTIRPAYSSWPAYNRRLRDAVAGLTEEQLAIRPSPGRWPALGDRRPPRLPARVLAVRLRR